MNKKTLIVILAVVANIGLLSFVVYKTILSSKGCKSVCSCTQSEHREHHEHDEHHDHTEHHEHHAHD